VSFTTDSGKAPFCGRTPTSAVVGVLSGNRPGRPAPERNRRSVLQQPAQTKPNCYDARLAVQPDYSWFLEAAVIPTFLDFLPLGEPAGAEGHNPNSLTSTSQICRPWRVLIVYYDQHGHDGRSGPSLGKSPTPKVRITMRNANVVFANQSRISAEARAKWFRCDRIRVTQ